MSETSVPRSARPPRHRRRGTVAIALLPLGLAASLGVSAPAQAQTAASTGPQSATAPAPTATTATSAATTTSAAQAGRASVALPDGLRPEGIASGPATTYYAGSMNDGSIVTGDFRRGTSSVLTAPAEGRQMRGMQYDSRTDLLWVAGNVGTVGHVYAVSATTGRIRADVTVPGSVFLNDLVVTDRAVWVTDSRVDRLTSIPLTTRGWIPPGAAPTFLPITGAWPAGDGTSISANGIRELPTGDLILNNSATGGLFQVPTASGVATEIPVTGGPGLTGGDGLDLHGLVLYDVRGSGDAEVSVLQLRRSGGAYRASWIGALTASSLDVPSTATYAAGSLWAVNARFGVASPETATYSITRLSARP